MDRRQRRLSSSAARPGGLAAILLLLCLALAGCSATGGGGSGAETESGDAGGVVVGASPQGPAVSGSPVFDFDARTVTLNSGYEMPILGLGTFSLSDEEAADSTYWALKAGFRLIDTARIYGNETGVGRGLQRAIDEGVVAREDVFITTKIWTTDYDDADAAINTSLERLGVDYIDLMILHHSQPANDVDAY